MLARLRTLGASFPRQFWIMVCGMLIVSIGGSMWWPFITIYLREELNIPLTQVTLLFTLNSVAGLVAISFVGPAVDRFGRRAAMIMGLVINGLALAHDGAGAWARPVGSGALTITGMFDPMYRVAADAMVADLIPAEGAAERLFRDADEQQPGRGRSVRPSAASSPPSPTVSPFLPRASPAWPMH